jgi:hypothetical protein
MPLRRQIRSNSTSAGRGLVNLPVNCLPLSLSTCWGQPNSRRVWTNAVHTARAVALGTTAAMTQYREWSSIPVTTFSSRPSVRKQEPTMSSCQSSIGASRCQRLYSLRFRRRGLTVSRSKRTRIR